MLYPQMTQTRMKFSLDGIWDFTLLKGGEEPVPGMPLHAPIPMPVPSSYNDIYQGRDFRDHVGDMAYQRELIVSLWKRNSQGKGVLKRKSPGRTQGRLSSF